MSKSTHVPSLKEYSIKDISLYIGRGQSPKYTDIYTNLQAINQKCVRHGRISPSESRHHDQSIAIRDSAILQNEDICINSTGNGTIGRVGIWIENNHGVYFADSHITILRVDKSKIKPKYLLELLQSQEFNNKIEIYCYSGSTNQVELSSSAFSKLTFQILPLDQQQSIADILTTIDNLIDHTESLIAKYQSIKQGMMHDLFTRGVDANGRLRPPREEAPELYKESALGWIPKEWEVVPLAMVIPSAQYGISHSLDDENGIPVLRMNNMYDGSFNLSDIKLCNKKINNKLLLNFNDVLFNRTNSMEHVGRTSIWKNELHTATFASYIVRLNLDANKLNQDFFVFWINQRHIQDAIRRFSTPGVHQVNINPKNLRKTLIALPTNVCEQKFIATKITQCNATLQGEIDLSDKLKKIKSGLMHDLLTGTVRTPPHLTPAQEPPHAV